VALRAAAEFLLRKDYRADWATELIEEYTFEPAMVIRLETIKQYNRPTNMIGDLA
jgi:hypothetical protein